MSTRRSHHDQDRFAPQLLHVDAQCVPDTDRDLILSLDPVRAERLSLWHDRSIPKDALAPQEESLVLRYELTPAQPDSQPLLVFSQAIWGANRQGHSPSR